MNSWLEQTARQTVMTLARAVGDGLDLTAPAPDVIRSAVHGAADLRRTHGTQRAAMTEILQNLRDEDGSPRFDQSDYDELYTAQEAIFRRGQAEGDFRKKLDPRAMAVAYQGAVDGMLGYLDAHPGADATRHADTVADVLLDGMRA